jgi:hypothetical protein
VIRRIVNNESVNGLFNTWKLAKTLTKSSKRTTNMRFADPKNDFAFKKIFGNENHKEILISPP